MKWVIAAAGIAFVGYAVWQFQQEAARARSNRGRKRQPWELT